jgi:hypothetical protein
LDDWCRASGIVCLERHILRCCAFGLGRSGESRHERLVNRLPCIHRSKLTCSPEVQQTHTGIYATTTTQKADRGLFASPESHKGDLKDRSIGVFGVKETDTSENGFADAPNPYRPRNAEGQPPGYQAYHPWAVIEHPDFPKDAIVFGLRASHPPQSSATADLKKAEREQVEDEQEQFYGSIKYGDQGNRGLDELARFRGDRISEVGKNYGLTAEDIERRRKLSSWDENDDSDVDSDLDEPWG